MEGVWGCTQSVSLLCLSILCYFFFFSTYVVCKRIYSVSQKKNVRVYFLNNSVKKLADFNNFWQTDCWINFVSKACIPKSRFSTSQLYRSKMLLNKFLQHKIGFIFSLTTNFSLCHPYKLTKLLSIRPGGNQEERQQCLPSPIHASHFKQVCNGIDRVVKIWTYEPNFHLICSLRQRAIVKNFSSMKNNPSSCCMQALLQQHFGILNMTYCWKMTFWIHTYIQNLYSAKIVKRIRSAEFCKVKWPQLWGGQAYNFLMESLLRTMFATNY